MEKKPKPEWFASDGTKLASKEEMWFTWWLEDLVKAGYVEHWTYQPRAYPLTSDVVVSVAKKLKTKTSFKKKTLLQDSTYTPDFEITWRQNAIGLFHADTDLLQYPLPLFFGTHRNSLIDVKGGWSQDAKKAKFSLIQKMLYRFHRLYVNRVEIPKLFGKTFSPSNPLFYLTPERQDMRKINHPVRTLAEFIESKEE